MNGQHDWLEALCLIVVTEAESETLGKIPTGRLCAPVTQKQRSVSRNSSVLRANDLWRSRQRCFQLSRRRAEIGITDGAVGVHSS